MKLYVLVHTTQVKTVLSFEDEEDAVKVMNQIYSDSLSNAMKDESWKASTLTRTNASITYTDGLIETFEVLPSDVVTHEMI